MEKFRSVVDPSGGNSVDPSVGNDGFQITFDRQPINRRGPIQRIAPPRHIQTIIAREIVSFTFLSRICPKYEYSVGFMRSTVPQQENLVYLFLDNAFPSDFHCVTV